LELTAAAPGYRTGSVVVTVANGESVVRDFQLTPIPVLENNSTEIVSESCRVNQSPEPGETITIDISLSNTGVAATQNLVAQLLAIGGVTSPSGPQNYGAMSPGGTAVSRPFTFAVSPEVACGDTVSLALSLSDGFLSYGIVIIDLVTGEPKIVYSEDFDRNSQAQLPQRWFRSAVNINGLSDHPRNWRVSTKRSISRAKSAFSPDPNQVGLNEMVTPVFALSSPNGRLVFQNWYELETTFLRNRLYDGSVLEIKIGDGEWEDILIAGGLFESGGYDGMIDSCCQNPLAGRLGWSGRSGVNQVSEFITTSVKLPPSAAGQFIQLRFRIGTDVGTFREGQYIDNIVVTDGFTCGCSGSARANMRSSK
jgi:hypothetical protein